MLIFFVVYFVLNGLFRYSQERLLSVVLGLLRQKRFRFLQVYKDEVYSIVKSSIKEVSFGYLLSYLPFTVKALLSPRRAFLISDTPEEGLLERELIRGGV